MERIALYYPSINIPDSGWLTSAILYSDRVSSIIPSTYGIDTISGDKTMKILRDEGLYRPTGFEEDDFFNFEELSDTFIKILDSDEYKKMMNNTHNKSNTPVNYWSMYGSKVSNPIAKVLIERNLLCSAEEYYKGAKMELELNTAMIYMSLLADYISKYSKDLVIPSTDNINYKNLAFKFSNNTKGAFKFHMEGCLPVPSEDVSIDKIVKFKQKRYDELLKFRLEIDLFQKKLRDVESIQESKELIIGFKEKIQIEIFEIKKILGDSKIDFILNSYSSLLDLKQKEILSTLGTITALNVGTKIIDYPLVGLGASSILLLATMISSYKKLYKNTYSNAYSYVYRAYKEDFFN